MKRDKRLQDLSREHHRALQLALQARRAAESGDPARVAATIAICLTAFSSELDPHFVVEETALLPRLVAAGEDDLAEQFVSDHAALRRFAADLEKPQSAGAATLRAFAERLTAHVRFEERELFPVLESLLDA